MTRIRSLLLLTLLLTQTEIATAARITLAFDGHISGIRTDGGIPLPAGIDITTSFSGTVIYDLAVAEPVPLTLESGSTGAAFISSINNHDLALNVGGYHIQSASQAAIFADDAVHVENQTVADVIFLPFTISTHGSYPFGGQHHQLGIVFEDQTASAMDDILLTEPLGADWRIPLELFGNVSFHIYIYDELLENHNSVWPPYNSYYLLEGQIDSIREVPLPAAGAMFAAALVQLLFLRRRLR